jgi:hypothetical protein
MNERFFHLTQQDLEHVAKAGARAALAEIGLGDEEAAVDMQEVRGFLKAYRQIKSNAKFTFRSLIGRALGWVFFLFVLWLLGRNHVPHGLMNFLDQK